MKYLFPNLFTTADFASLPTPDFPFTAGSGESAMRLVIRSWKLGPKSRIAVPAFVCGSVARAVVSEGHTPVRLDLKPNASFWTDYSDATLQEANVDAIVLVHMYGFLHPDSAAVEAFAAAHKLPLLYDLAQCYGVDESPLNPELPRVYSFNVGKPATGAFGGLIRNIDAEFYRAEIASEPMPGLQKARMKQFIKSRIYNYEYSLADKLKQKFQAVFGRLRFVSGILAMTEFQKQVAGEAIRLQEANFEARKKRYDMLVAAVEEVPALSVAYDDGAGLYFKCTLVANEGIDQIRQFLRDNDVPHFVLADDLHGEVRNTEVFPEFNSTAPTILELPCEASIPFSEIQRLAVVLQNIPQG